MSGPLPDNDNPNLTPATTPTEARACPFRGFTSAMREVSGWARQTVGLAKDIGFIVAAAHLLPHYDLHPVPPAPAVCAAPVNITLIYNN